MMGQKYPPQSLCGQQPQFPIVLSREMHIWDAVIVKS